MNMYITMYQQTAHRTELECGLISLSYDISKKKVPLRYKCMAILRVKISLYSLGTLQSDPPLGTLLCVLVV